MASSLGSFRLGLWKDLRDRVVESSKDRLMRWEKQDKTDQDGLNKSLGISICDSLAISIVTLHYFLLLSCLRPTEMRSSTSQTICWNHFKSLSDANDQWPRVECSEVNGRWMADNSIRLNGELLSEHFHGFWIHLITSYSLPYLPSSLSCKVSSYFIFQMQRLRKKGIIDLSKLTQVYPGFQDWFRQKPHLHLWSCRQILWVLGP